MVTPPDFLQAKSKTTSRNFLTLKNTPWPYMVATAARKSGSAQSSKHQGAGTEGKGQRGRLLAHMYLSLLQACALHRALAVAGDAFEKEKFFPATKEASDCQRECKKK